MILYSAILLNCLVAFVVFQFIFLNSYKKSLSICFILCFYYTIIKKKVYVISIWGIYWAILLWYNTMFADIYKNIFLCLLDIHIYT